MSVWVFDLDGTVISNFTDYGFPVFDFGKLMLAIFDHRAPHYRDILHLEHEIDNKRFEMMRAHRTRFPGSLVGVYRELCRRDQVEPDLLVEEQCWEIGVSAISEGTYQNRSMIPGAEATLALIQGQGDLLRNW